MTEDQIKDQIKDQINDNNNEQVVDEAYISDEAERQRAIFRNSGDEENDTENENAEVDSIEDIEVAGADIEEDAE